MANLGLIKELCEQSGMTIRSLASKVDLTDTSIHQMIRNGATNTSTLEKIAEVLGVSAGVFFDEYSPLPKKEDLTNDSFLTIIAEKDRQIAEKDAQIKRLFDLLEKK